MKNNRIFIALLISAVLIKFFLFIFLAVHAPQGRFQADSTDYLETSRVLSSQGAFAKANADGSLRYEFYRTPGYPVFLAFLQGLIKLPLNAVIFIQIFLAILAAWVTYKTALQIDHKIAFLSALIVLYDPPVSIFSLMILAETLFLFLMSLFMWSFIKYLKNRKISLLALSALVLVMATYVRPISYYLGWAIAIFVIYANMRAIPVERDCFAPSGLAMTERVGFTMTKAGRAMTHALIFLVIVYSLLGIWQERNYKRFGQKSFCAVAQSGYKYFGLYKSYSRNKDVEAKGLAPVAYYTKTTIRSFLYLMTRPGPFKYFKSQILSAVGNAFAYPWMVFWVIGFIIGIAKTRGNIYCQFLLFLVAYFVFVSIGGVSLLVSERFRVPMVPFIAIISAYGWLNLSKLLIDRRS